MSSQFIIAVYNDNVINNYSNIDMIDNVNYPHYNSNY
jgi:hypothetical protein